ncbi:hypothetical protein [Methylobacterium sp. PvR107]|uniref:hypothetical protein n=1 Tax=Methylobacterium sp. PvR107 TaxID=2806597 RepID=UPI001AE98181|nr:hypothetical protein [Methylobacterium sp. PvR107]MBP1179967.1 hypothetical protein [Methylobacterium sp. PvR107]
MTRRAYVRAVGQEAGMRFQGSVLAGLLLLGPASAQEAAQPTKLTPKQIEAVKKGVRQSLRDPDSARFDRPFIAARDSAGILKVCGFVNAKNTYGGYAGDTAFVGTMFKNNTIFLPNSITGSDSGQYATRAVCAKEGIVLD